uniref:Uncharacterized protein n=1 Tax=Bionectria ochroleuca TaxID=29856 RepID=A0A8H7NCB1_BIOOC
MARTDVGWWDTGCSSYKLRANGMPPGNIGHQDAQSKYECVSIAAALIPNQGSEMNGEIEGGAAPGRSPAPWRVICTGPLIRTRTVRLSLSLNSPLPSRSRHSSVEPAGTSLRSQGTTSRTWPVQASHQI